VSGRELQLFCWWCEAKFNNAYFSYALLNLTSKCAAMCDSQNGFAEKCAVA
jgi:hypothetical protein